MPPQLADITQQLSNPFALISVEPIMAFFHYPVGDIGDGNGHFPAGRKRFRRSFAIGKEPMPAVSGHYISAHRENKTSDIVSGVYHARGDTLILVYLIVLGNLYSRAQVH